MGEVTNAYEDERFILGLDGYVEQELKDKIRNLLDEYGYDLYVKGTVNDMKFVLRKVG
jgi:hypothetical protein